MPLFCVRAGHVIYNKMLSSRLRCLILAFVLLVPNFVALIYLGSVHQGAPIRINQRIRQLVAHGSERRYTVHYLMGCHSTPLYSHLHVPSARIYAWTLDCSPKCRASPDVGCESEHFSKDPARFVDTVYSLAEVETDSCTVDDQDGHCSFETKEVPDLMAVYSQEAFILKGRLESMGLEEVDRFVHGINGLNVGSLQFGDAFTNESFRHVNLFGMVELSIEDMILFAKPELMQSRDS